MPRYARLSSIAWRTRAPRSRAKTNIRPGEREHEHHGVGLRRRQPSRQQPDGRQQHVDERDPAQQARLELRRDAEAGPLADRRVGAVDRELSGEREQEDGPVAQLRRAEAGRGDHRRGPDRVPGVANPDEHAARMAVAAQVLGEAAQQHAGRHQQRHGPGRHEEEHRHQHQLGRDREAMPDREANARHDGVDGDESARQQGVEGALGRHERRHRHVPSTRKAAAVNDSVRSSRPRSGSG